MAVKKEIGYDVFTNAMDKQALDCGYRAWYHESKINHHQSMKQETTITVAINFFVGNPAIC